MVRALTILAIGLMATVTACGGTSNAPGTSGAAGTYTVSSIVEAYPDGTARACRAVYLTAPGDCAGGIPISNLGQGRLPFAGVAQAHGAYFTPILKLTGLWTGSGLALTAPPVPAAAASAPRKEWSAAQPPAQPQLVGGVVTRAGLLDQEALLADLGYLQQHGVVVMENGFNEAGLYIVVAAGDAATVNLLRSRYRVQEIDAWLQPAGSA